MSQNDRYERVVLSTHWDGLIGPSSHTDEVVVMRCTECESLVLPGQEGAHDAWHKRIDHIAANANLGARSFSRGGRIG